MIQSLTKQIVCVFVCDVSTLDFQVIAEANLKLMWCNRKSVLPEIVFNGKCSVRRAANGLILSVPTRSFFSPVFV